MKRIRLLSLRNLRTFLPALVLLALLPALGLAVYNGYESRRQAEALALEQAFNTVRTAASRQELAARSARQLVRALSLLPEIRYLDIPGSSAVFGELLKQNPEYANIYLVSTTGAVICSAKTMPLEHNEAARDYFKDVLETQEFAVGTYRVSPSGGQAVLTFGAPIRSDKGKVHAVLALEYDLSYLAGEFNSARLPEHSTLAVCDRAGTILFRLPDPASWVGLPIQTSLMRAMTTDRDEGTNRDLGIDGVRRIYAFKRLTFGKREDDLYVRVGIPETVIFGEANAALRNNLLLVAAVAAVVLLLCKVLGERLILNPANDLVRVSRRLARGDLKARPDLAHDGGDLGELARAFDLMAQSLAAREAGHLQTQEELRASAEKIRALINATSDSVFLVDTRGIILDLNANAARRRDKKIGDLIGRSLYDNLPPEAAITRREHLEMVCASKREQAFDEVRDGRYYRLRVYPIFDARGQVVQMASFSRDITERREAEEAIQRSLREKEVLLKEIHHRVKNNLQIVSSLLNLQAGRIEDPAALEAFRESVNRVLSMALVHQILYQSKDLAQVDFATYVNRMIVHLRSIYGADEARVTILTDVEGVALGIDAAVPCGLIIGELASNALKYAFPDGRKGTVHISLKAAPEGGFLLSVRDNGAGLPPGLDMDAPESLGLSLVLTLVEQLHGNITVERKDGAGFLVHFRKA